jgi:hypothetical protein
MDDSRIRRRGFIAMAGATVAGVGGLLAGAHTKAAGGPRLTVGPIRRVGADGAKHVEPWIAANPCDASNLVVVGTRHLGAAAAAPAGFHMEPAAWFTTDGGDTWAAGELAGIAELRRDQAYFADAYATYTPDGMAFCVFNGSPKGDRLDLWVYRSEDRGRHWQGPTHLAGGGLDYPRLAADRNQGRSRVFIVVAVEGDRPIMEKLRKPGYGCAILRSDDGGRTFSAVNFLAPTTLQHDPINSPLILPDGGLLVGFADYVSEPMGEKSRKSLTHSRTYTALSRDGGETFSTPAPIRDTLLQDGFLVLAVDRSDGPRRGRVYAVAFSRTENPPGLQLQTSDDGAVWTPPAPVPNLRAGSLPFAAAEVSLQGVLGLVWIQGKPGDPVRFDNEAWTAREHAWDLYFTASSDGGTTFAAPLPLLETSSRTDPKLSRWPYGTDYISLAATPDGAFHPLWVDTRNSKGEIQTVRIEVQA